MRSEARRSRRRGCAAGAAVRVDHVAVDVQRVLPERLQVDDRTEGPPDEALNLHGAAGLLAAGCLARDARIARAGDHAVFAGDPAAGDALLAHPSGDPLFERGGADDLGAADLDERGGDRMGEVVGGDAEFARLGRRAAVNASGVVHGIHFHGSKEKPPPDRWPTRKVLTLRAALFPT